MRDSQCHACALHIVVVTRRDTLENNFWTFQNFHHDMTRITSSDPHRHASPRTLTRVLPSLARQIADANNAYQIACRGVNRLSCQCSACFKATCEHFYSGEYEVTCCDRRFQSRDVAAATKKPCRQWLQCASCRTVSDDDDIERRRRRASKLELHNDRI